MSNFSFIPAATTVRSAAIAPTDNPSYLQFVGNAVKNNDVIILNRDTSMKGKGFVQLFETLAKPLSENRKKVVVPQAVLAELRHTADSPDTQESRKAKEAMEDMLMMREPFVMWGIAMWVTAVRPRRFSSIMRSWLSSSPSPTLPQ